jgi:membrane-bound acyltransferase YfiQ involved in biofilm formation
MGNAMARVFEQFANQAPAHVAIGIAGIARRDYSHFQMDMRTVPMMFINCHTFKVYNIATIIISSGLVGEHPVPPARFVYVHIRGNK